MKTASDPFLSSTTEIFCFSSKMTYTSSCSLQIIKMVPPFPLIFSVLEASHFKNKQKNCTSISVSFPMFSKKNSVTSFLNV